MRSPGLLVRGCLAGTLILGKMDRSNFLTVFFIRRACRTLPAYAVSVIMLFVLARYLGDRSWIEVDAKFTLWSYLSFTQNVVMAIHETIGPPWLAPTWTLALEEHFYLLLLFSSSLLRVADWRFCSSLWRAPLPSAWQLKASELISPPPFSCRRVPMF